MRATLGNRRNAGHAAELGQRVQISEADRFSANPSPIIEAIRRSGATSLAAITDAINAHGIRSARGGRWHASALRNLLARAEHLRPDLL